MEIRGKGKIYKNNYGYSFCESQKEIDGTYKNYYYPIKFRKGLEVPQENELIEIMGFMKFYTTKDDRPISYYLVMSYEVLEGLKTQKEPRKYKYFVVQLEKHGEYKYIIQKSTNAGNVKKLVDEDIPQNYYTHYFHFDKIVTYFDTQEEAQAYINKNFVIHEKDPFNVDYEPFGEQVSIDNFLE